MSTKILPSFEQGLPVLDIKPRNDPYHKFSSNAKSIIMAKPVPVFFHEATASLVNLATDRLQTIEEFEFDEYMPGVEKTHLNSVEADVARASAQHLVYPINMVLPELFQGIDILCHSEVTQGQHNRFYVRWTIARPGQPKLTFAILEYKREGAFGGKTLNWHCTLEDNAETISKQAREHSTTCKDIAVFDWNSLFIFNFNHVDEDNYIPVRGSFFDEREDAGTFRLVLLGFLIRALKRHLPEEDVTMSM